MNTSELYANLVALARLDADLTTQLHTLLCAIHDGLGQAEAMDDPALAEAVATMLAVFPDLAARATGFNDRLAYWRAVEAALAPFIQPSPPLSI